jgi:cell division protein ZapA (FtsZ GTPase activity inhibitor)
MKVQVTIQGRTYTVRSDEPGIDLPALARYVDARIQEVADRAPPGLDPYTVAMLACLNVASDFERYRRDVALALDAIDQDLASSALVLRSALPSGGPAAEPSDRDLADDGAAPIGLEEDG